jgi:hypothetical protein
MEWVARDTAAQSMDSRMATTVWRAAANHIPSYRGAYGGAPVMIIHNLEPLRLGRVSS